MKKRPNTEQSAVSRITPKSAGQRLRIIGGRWRGHQIAYSGDPRTRPMKDNIREAVFNLIGGWIPGKHAIDLFAGTGAIGLEALSRGAVHATLIERHIPTARIIEQNVASLGATSQVTIEMSDTFYWARQIVKQPDPPREPWAVFCSPPYALYDERKDDMSDLIHLLWSSAPEGSVFVIEADDRFDPATLPQASQWRRRKYSPAHIYVWRPKDIGSSA